jgi:nicotinate-nucleotide pyrophosphorylase (carboxylating)
MENEVFDKFIESALLEDIGDGDHTSLATIPILMKGNARLLVKQNGVIAGIDIAKKVFHKLDNDIIFEPFMVDGQYVKPGDIAFQISGLVIAILQAERLVLNIMQRLSGIATQTREYVDKLQGLKTKILDTRKTTPGMRLLEKYAVKTGGGENHRFGLYDMILIKDNHIDFAGGIENAIDRVHEYLKIHYKTMKVEIEARSINDINTILEKGGIDRILLDNFTPEQTKMAVSIIGNKAEIESSGNITLENIRSYAECGVDYISVGALTHQIKSIDLSLKAF